MTVKQLKEVLEEMKGIYPYKDDETAVALTTNMMSMRCPIVEIHTTDEKTKISITLSKEVNNDY